MKAYEIQGDDGIDALALVDRPDPRPGPGQVLVRIRASSINYRDLAVVLEPTARGVPLGRIPNSDGAGDVVAVGDGVTRFKPGDRVAGTFFQRWVGGPITDEAMASALGGPEEGLLCELAVLGQDGLVKVPDHLSFEEASTLPCAALTAWHGLVEKGGLRAGDHVLLLGTGGVSMFALQFAKMHGARVTITSSSDQKLEQARALGADDGINYKTTPDWDRAVLDLTGGRGVDQVVEVGGPCTLEKSVAAVRVGGRISLIGILTGVAGAVAPTPVMRKSVCVQGIYVGSRAMFESMNRAIATGGLKPVIDKVFPFEDARAAYHAMAAAGHVGKLVVRV